MLRAVLLIAAFTVCASPLGAQITTYIAPPRAPEPSRDMIAAADSARRDSVSRVAMTNMKAWVDSAAGIAVPENVGDSIVVRDSVRPISTFDNGAVAPATASALPALVLVGGLIFLTGIALVSQRHRG